MYVHEIHLLYINLFLKKYVFIISAIAGILLKSQDVYFFFSSIFVVILNNSDILFGSEYKREI